MISVSERRMFCLIWLLGGGGMGGGAECEDLEDEEWLEGPEDDFPLDEEDDDDV